MFTNTRPSDVNFKLHLSKDVCQSNRAKHTMHQHLIIRHFRICHNTLFALQNFA